MMSTFIETTAIWRDAESGDGSFLNTGNLLISVFYQGGWWVKTGLATADMRLIANSLDEAKVAAIVVVRKRLLNLISSLPEVERPS